MDGNRRIGYTAGAFDLFHIGHLNLLRRSRESCDHLIVGVSTDELIRRTKGHDPVIPFAERMEIVSSVRYVDQVVAQGDLDKVEAWRRLRYHRLFSGDDWKGNPRWAGYEEELRKVGVEVVYFPYTRSTSSTLLQSVLSAISKER